MDQPITLKFLGQDASWPEITDAQIQITMSREDYSFLLVLLGYATGAFLSKEGPAAMYRCIKFVNRLNATNPDFVQYEIPKEYQ